LGLAPSSGGSIICVSAIIFGPKLAYAGADTSSKPVLLSLLSVDGLINHADAAFVFGKISSKFRSGNCVVLIGVRVTEGLKELKEAERGVAIGIE